jgi:hypothetical protein
MRPLHLVDPAYARFRPGSSRAEESAGGGNHGCGSVDDVDDLGVVDPLKVDRRDTEIGVPEFALDDDERDALAGHFNVVGMAKLVRRKATSHAGARCDLTQLHADRGRCPGPPATRPIDHTEHRADRHLLSGMKPRLELQPARGVHADLAPLSALAAADVDRAAVGVEIALRERKRLTDLQAGAPEHDDYAAQAPTVDASK